MTSSKTGTLYFAYGSNLSPTQMQYRCVDAPDKSAIPVAIARLDRWQWVICERGYANIVPLHQGAHDVQVKLKDSDDHERTVWGVLYNMTPGDVEMLDQYEGHDEGRNPWPERNLDPLTAARTPFLQGDWDYNKWYIDVVVTKWLQPPSVLGLSNSPNAIGHDVVKVLAYVDELRTGVGPILQGYIGRMNRAIEEGVALGVPRRWVDGVMRRWVVPGIFPEHGYVGTNEGYVPEKVTESSAVAAEVELLREEEWEREFARAG